MKDILVIQGGGRPKGNTAHGVLAVMRVDMENHAFKKMRSMILLPG